MDKPLNSTESLELMKTYNTAFPDIKFNIECQFGEGEYIVTRFSAEGTNKGEFQGSTPSNKKVKITGNSIHRVKDGKIIEEWTEFDALGLMQQIGAIPEMAAHNH